jgi:small subunit ribosomal protein S17
MADEERTGQEPETEETQETPVEPEASAEAPETPVEPEASVETPPETPVEPEASVETPPEPPVEPEAPEPPVEPEASAEAPPEPTPEVPPEEPGPPVPEPESPEPTPEPAPPGEPVAEGEEAPAEEQVAVAPVKKKRKRIPRSERRQRPKPKREQTGERKPVTRLPKPEGERGRRQERRGVVVSAAMDKTIVVKVETVKAHPRYKKVVRRSERFHAHDEQNQAKAGDVVRIVETRPLSKTKNWRLAEVVEAAR